MHLCKSMILSRTLGVSAPTRYLARIIIPQTKKYKHFIYKKHKSKIKSQSNRKVATPVRKIDLHTSSSHT